MGAAGGALVTAGVIWVAVQTSDDPSAELFGLIYGQVLVPAGALVGGIGGAVTAPVRERWRPASLGILDPSSLGGEAIPLARRARVRVVAPAVLDRPVTGEILDGREGMLILATADGGELRISTDAVQRLEVSRGRNRVGRAFLGGAIGGAVGAAYGAGVQWANRDEFTTSQGIIYTAALLGTFGAGLGAAAGALLAPERWTVPVPNLVVEPGRGGVAVGLGLPVH